MKRIFITIELIVILSVCCSGQYTEHGFYLSGGISSSRYLGSGHDNNYFKTVGPGYQLEAAFNDGNGMGWLIWGITHYNIYNHSSEGKVSVGFWIPYYTEVLLYSKAKRNPFFGFIGYDHVRMKFPDSVTPVKQNNITFGGGWILKLSNNFFLQFKLKPYFILGNSIKKSEEGTGQFFGINSALNLQIGF